MAQDPYAPPQSNVEAQPAVAAAPEGPSGIGGWLILPLLGLIFGPIRVMLTVVKDLLPAFQEPVWSRLTVPGSDVYHPYWAPLLIFEIAANLLVVGFAIALLWLFFRKSRRLPGLFIAWLLFNIAIQVVDWVVVAQIPAAAGANAEGTKELVRAVVGAAIWIPYFRISVRVRNTFTR